MDKVLRLRERFELVVNLLLDPDTPNLESKVKNLINLMAYELGTFEISPDIAFDIYEVRVKDDSIKIKWKYPLHMLEVIYDYFKSLRNQKEVAYK